MRFGKTWTSDEIDRLFISVGEGKSLKLISEEMKRTPGAIFGMMKRLKLPTISDGRCYKHWSSKEIEDLIDEFESGMTFDNMALIHGRTAGSIRSKIYLSL